ncbi:MAG: ribosome biogenesis GTPase Der, partial [Sphingobacteriales bacterium]
FNRLLEQRKAIVDDFSGVTRDRQYGVAEWNGKSFNLIDTGGFVASSDDVFEIEIKKQVEIAVEEAHLIIFVVDTMTGITSQDTDMADVLRRSPKPVLLVVNKVDNATRALDATEFYSLGFEHTFFLSSISGSGTGEMLDELVSHIEELPKQLDENGEEIEEDSTIPKFAIIGQPNAGKSTLLNALVGEERTIVSDIPGTTRDTIHTYYKQFGKEFVLIDTAGLRKKKNVHEDLEFYSVIRAIRALDEADVCFIVI